MAQCEVDPDQEKKLEKATARVAAFAREQAVLYDLDVAEILGDALATVNREFCEVAERMLDALGRGKR